MLSKVEIMITGILQVLGQVFRGQVDVSEVVGIQHCVSSVEGTETVDSLQLDGDRRVPLTDDLAMVHLLFRIPKQDIHQRNGTPPEITETVLQKLDLGLLRRTEEQLSLQGYLLLVSNRFLLKSLHSPSLQLDLPFHHTIVLFRDCKNEVLRVTPKKPEYIRVMV